VSSQSKRDLLWWAKLWAVEVNGYQIGSGADLSGANLSGANLSGADLSGVNLTDAILTDAILTDAILSEGALNSAKESTTTTTITEGKLVDSAAGMICVPGSCTGTKEYRDSQYLKDVKTNVPRSYYDNISDGQIFKMAYYWCNLLEQNQWTEIEKLFDNVYKRGNRNEQLLSIWTLLGAVAQYCLFTHNEKVVEFLTNLKKL
jgi:hypothetical protein